MSEFHKVMSSDFANRLQIGELSEFIKDQLYYMVLSNQKDSSTVKSFKDWKKSHRNSSVYYFNVDDSLEYDGFFSDFGPLNLAMIYRYIFMLREKLEMFKIVVHCSHKGDPKKRANAAFLICAYMIIENKWTANQAYTTLSDKHKHQYLSFRDASCLLHSEYSVTVEECVNALYKAMWYGFFDFSDFDLNEYERYETVKYGDINWIVPGTLMAFSSPHHRDYIDKSGYQIHSPAYYFNYFKENNVKHVVRLNSKKTYDAKRTFVATANIQHTDLVFTDGTPPSDSILQRFLSLCEQYIDDGSEIHHTNNKISDSSVIATNNIINNEASAAKYGGAVAVHCKAGLGRTGCLVASYIMKHWPFTAEEAIAWTRICRPGSVIGVQQHWLIGKEKYLKTAGKQWREKNNHPINKYKRFTNGVYSIKRHTSNPNEFKYVEPPPKSHVSSKNPPSCSTSDDSETEHVQPEEQKRHSYAHKSKLKTSNHLIADSQSDVLKPNLRHKRSASKNEDQKLKSTPSMIRNSRRVTNSSIDLNVCNPSKKKSTIPNSITITRSNSNASVIGKRYIKTVTLNKFSPRLTRKSTQTEITTKIDDESKPSYASATVASSARVLSHLRNLNEK